MARGKKGKKKNDNYWYMNYICKCINYYGAEGVWIILLHRERPPENVGHWKNLKSETSHFSFEM